MLHTGVHSFDLLRFLTGCEVTRVWCRTAQIITRETEDSFAMTCQLSNPSLVATIAGSRAMGGRAGLVGPERLTLPVPFPGTVPSADGDEGSVRQVLYDVAGVARPVLAEADQPDAEHWAGGAVRGAKTSIE